METVVKNGDHVAVQYTGRLEDGSIFVSSQGREPLTFEVGASEVIQGFDEALVGMHTGDKKSITIAPAEGYGEHNSELVFDFPKHMLPEDLACEVGSQLQLVDENQQAIPVIVADIQEDTILLDANHPLAGKTLTFDIELLEIA